MRKLYKFQWDCGRMGEVEGIVVADDAEVAGAIGKDVYFGEILGKHSEVYGTLAESEMVVISEDQEFIDKLIDVFKVTAPNPLWLEVPSASLTITGYNPLHSLQPKREDDDA